MTIANPYNQPRRLTLPEMGPSSTAQGIELPPVLGNGFGKTTARNLRAQAERYRAQAEKLREELHKTNDQYAAALAITDQRKATEERLEALARVDKQRTR